MNASDAITDLIIEVFRLNGGLLASGNRLVSALGLTSARWQVMGAIALSPVPLPAAHLARNMGLTRQSVHRLIDEMEREGLVRLEPNAHHMRAKLVLLTDLGTATYEQASELQRPWARSLAVKLTAEQILTATSTLRRIRQRLAAEKKEGDLKDA